MRALLVLVLCLFAAPVQAADATAERYARLLELDSLRGPALTPAALEDRVVAVVFFASWCPPCHAEFRHLNAVAARFAGRGLTIVAVNVFEDFGGLSSPDQLQAFLARYDPRFAVLSGTPDTRRAFDDLDRIPSLYLFDRQGRLALRFRHAPKAKKTHLSEAELIAAIAPLL